MKRLGSERSIKNEEISQNIYKIDLTDAQVNFVNQLLPSNYSLKSFQITDEKRIRTPKKTDEMYQMNFTKKTVKDETKKQIPKTQKQDPQDKNIEKVKEKPVKEKKQKEAGKEDRGKKKGEIEKNKGKKIIIEEQNKSVEDVEEKSQNSQIVFKKKQFCLSFLKKLKSHKSAWPFRQPVDPVGQGVPNYLDIVKDPMDLKTIERKLSSNKYHHISEFYGDINKIFLNSYKFNPRETQYYTLTVQFQGYYTQLVKQAEKNPNSIGNSQKCKKIKSQTQFLNSECQIKKKKTSLVPQKQKKQITLKQKKQLAKKIKQLSSGGLGEVVNIIYESEGKEIEDTQLVFNIDLQKLRDETLQNVENCLKKMEEEHKSRNNLGDTKVSLF